MATTFAPRVESLTDLTRERARAEAREVEAMLSFREAEMARTAGVEPPMRRQVERAAVPLAIGEATGLSEGQVMLMLSTAQTVRDQAPQAWAAFTEGRIDRARVRDIGHAIDQLQRHESIARLRRFVQRVESDLAVERADAERANRYVSVRHSDDAMGWLSAYLPSHHLAAIES